MDQFTRSLICCAVLISLVNVLTHAATLPYDTDLDNYSPQDVEELYQILEDVPQKRGMCRPGYTYQAILRECVPSLGALRGRLRTGRRGRRGLGAWSWV